jgi:hypothetical protein
VVNSVAVLAVAPEATSDAMLPSLNFTIPYKSEAIVSQLESYVADYAPLAEEPSVDASKWARD